LGQGVPVLKLEQSHSGWGRLRAFGVVRSKARAREAAPEVGPAGARVRRMAWW